MPDDNAPASGSGQLLSVAAAHCTPLVPTARPGQSAGDVRAALAGTSFDCADDVAVLEGATLVGMISIEHLLSAGSGARVETLMDDDPPVVSPDADQELVAWRLVERGESSVAVVDKAGRFVGLIPPHRMLAVLLAEHDEDLARLGGYLARTERARTAAEETVARRLQHRLPWLLVGLLGAMASAGIVGAFEDQLAETVLIAFFLPAVVYLADAVGTQTEAILIRGLSVGVRMRDVARRELLSGAVIGILLGVAFLPFAIAVWGDTEVAVAVALALVASCSIATVVAMALPWAFQRFGIDPAFGSGPLATVIQDLLSIMVYLVIATALTS